MRKKTKNICAY